MHKSGKEPLSKLPLPLGGDAEQGLGFTENQLVEHMPMLHLLSHYLHVSATISTNPSPRLDHSISNSTVATFAITSSSAVDPLDHPAASVIH